MKTVFNIIVVCYAYVVASCGNSPEPETYLIPVGFNGRVNVIFGHNRGDSIMYEDGRRVYKIPASGILLTQFESETGFINHKYYYVDSLGEKTPLPIFVNDDENMHDTGVFRDGTVGVFRSSNNTTAYPFQEFYIGNGGNFKKYFSYEYTKQFENDMEQVIGNSF